MANSQVRTETDQSGSLNLGFVSDSIYPYNKGGKEKRLFEISTRLAKRGHDVTIYTMGWWDGSPTRMEHGVTLQAISPKLELYTTDRRRSIGQALRFGWATISPLWHARHDLFEVDHIPYVQLFVAGILTRFRRIPLSATWHEVWGRKLWQEYLGIPKGWLASKTEWWSVRMPRRIISVSSHTTNGLLTQLRVARDLVTTIPNGIDLAEIEAIPQPEKKYDVIFVGRLLAHKNADLVLRTMAALRHSRPQASCLIIGEGPEEQRLKELAGELGISEQVTFRGAVPTEEVYQSYKASRVCLAPSSREGFGIVAIEANAAGLPVITIDAPDNAMKDLIHENVNGFVRSADANVLADLLNELLHDPARLTQLLASAKQSAVQYDWEEITTQVESCYRRWIRKSS